MVKQRFGKGPETCYVILKGKRLYVYMRNFITPAEEVLLNNSEINLATNFRSAVINVITKEFVPEVSQFLGIAFDSFFHDWNYDTNTGILLIECASSEDKEKIEMFFENDLFKTIEQVSSRLHKIPDRLKIVKFTQNICVIESKGVLLHLESFLYLNGNSNLLLHHSREIKNGYLIHKTLFEELFNRSIVDMFILWDYEKDRNYLIFNFYK